MAVALKHGDVVDKYLQVVPGAGTLADAFLDTIEGGIASQQLPVKISRETATAGLFGGVRGNKRPIILLELTRPHLQGFAMHIFGVASGVNLCVGWYLTEEGRGGKNLAKGLGSLGGGVLGAAAAMQDMMRNLNIFDLADLGAVVGGVHQFAVMEGIYAIATKVGFDRDRIARQSSGFFGVG
jgi:hypothetical protein